MQASGNDGVFSYELPDKSKRRFRLDRVVGDGNCFFRAIGSAGNLGISHQALRANLVQFIRERFGAEEGEKKARVLDYHNGVWNRYLQRIVGKESEQAPLLEAFIAHIHAVAPVPTNDPRDRDDWETYLQRRLRPALHLLRDEDYADLIIGVLRQDAYCGRGGHSV